MASPIPNPIIDSTIATRPYPVSLLVVAYATEAATAWLNYAFDELDVPRVISITDRPNTRSLAVMRRLGMTLDHEADVEDDGVTFQALIHTLTAEQWKLSPLKTSPN